MALSPSLAMRDAKRPKVGDCVRAEVRGDMEIGKVIRVNNGNSDQFQVVFPNLGKSWHSRYQLSKATVEEEAEFHRRVAAWRPNVGEYLRTPKGVGKVIHDTGSNKELFRVLFPDSSEGSFAPRMVTKATMVEEAQVAEAIARAEAESPRRKSSETARCELEGASDAADSARPRSIAGLRSSAGAAAVKVTRLAVAKASEAAQHRGFQAGAVSAVGGAAIVGTGGGVVGLTVGGALGAACGVVPALFTFGLSIPLGAALGSGAGLCLGAITGSAVGLVGGGATGYGVHTWGPKVYAGLMRSDRQDPNDRETSEAAGKATALQAAGRGAAAQRQVLQALVGKEAVARSSSYSQSSGVGR